MKRIIALLLVVLMIGAVLAACGESSKTEDVAGAVKTTVSKDYDDGYAKNFANKTTTGNDGNTTYEFESKKYDEYVTNHVNVVSSEITADVKEDFGSDYLQFAFVNVDKKALIIGVNPGKYDAAKAEACAPAYAEKAFQVFLSLEEPITSISVIYCSANDQQEVYGTFDFNAK